MSVAKMLVWGFCKHKRKKLKKNKKIDCRKTSGWMEWLMDCCAIWDGGCCLESPQFWSRDASQVSFGCEGKKEKKKVEGERPTGGEGLFAKQDLPAGLIVSERRT
jgi:hypothetical protein